MNNIYDINDLNINDNKLSLKSIDNQEFDFELCHGSYNKCCCC